MKIIKELFFTILEWVFTALAFVSLLLRELFTFTTDILEKWDNWAGLKAYQASKRK